VDGVALLRSSGPLVAPDVGTLMGAASGLTTVGGPKVLPVTDTLVDLFPWGGLRRGSTVAVRGSTSLLFALLAAASADGSWAVLVGMPRAGVLAAAELGVVVERLALVPSPGPDPARVLAALLDGIDLVAVATTGAGVSPSTARRLSARARHRGAVLLSFGPWPGADVELSCSAIRWAGLGNGSGALTGRSVTVSARGRGAASRPVHRTVRLPEPVDSKEADSDLRGP